ncbi:unnamed protein product [Cylicocyclus nassatus]|uniref:Uncharacterized protein n=1 Tax=Cylicocyclus nassatus TaxID=53992 RepID=A0AA36GQW4_CYLNA|nr:unnamed protein product [Cylicocyclus nassatus]
MQQGKYCFDIQLKKANGFTRTLVGIRRDSERNFIVYPQVDRIGGRAWKKSKQKCLLSDTIKARLGAGGGTGGSTVTVTPLVTQGTHIADITVDGVNKEIYAPTGGGTGGISDVQINGTSITADAFGINKNSSGVIYVANASDAEITARASAYKPVTPSNLNYAVTAVLTDGKAPALTDAQKAAAQSWLGIDTILGLVNAVSEVLDEYYISITGHESTLRTVC